MLPNKMEEWEIDGELRKFGNVRIDDVPRSYRWRYMGDAVPLIPRDKWKPINLNQWLPPVKDQDGIGACNAFGTVTVAETCRAIQGLDPLSLSCGYLYGNINGGRDQGSMLEDAMARMLNHGTCPSSVVGDLDWRASNKWQEAQRQAGAYRFLECYVCPEGRDLIDAMVSSLQMGFVLNTGLLWYDNYTPDSSGKLPKQKRGRFGGHAFCVYGCDIEPDGIWFHMRNSWGERWGKGGNALVHESAYTNDIGGIYACRSFSDTGAEIPAPVSENAQP